MQAIKVKFYLRTPGSHAHMVDAMMTSVPRENDGVSLGEQGNVYTVHSVTWLPQDDEVRILVR